MYDIIGDVHGYYLELHQLLINMGYRYDEGAHLFYHPRGRIAVFIGDYIDRGSYNKKVVELVRNMERAGLARAIMGNHDFAAVQYVTPHPTKTGEFLRRHSEGNTRQHGKFLVEAKADQEFYRSAIEWFKELPLYLKLDNNHLVHACWYPPAIQLLQAGGCLTADGRLTEKGWLAEADQKSDNRLLIDLLLKGPEDLLHREHAYIDIHDISRHRPRLAWWKDSAATMGDAYVSIPPSWAFANEVYAPKKTNPFIADIRDQLRKMPADERVFIGHIWERGEPAPLSDKICCVDYSIACAGKLVAYRTEIGETTFHKNNFVWIDCMDAPASRNDGPLITTVIDVKLSLT